jgi:hypothetical protein
MIRRLLRRVRRLAAVRERVSGEPRSANGASSFHLVWDLGSRPLQRVEATLEILESPTTNRLYFWALQVSFGGGRRMHGAAHIGLQWNARFPGGTAVNWGGYGPGGSSGLLHGTTSELPSARNDPNTRDYPWVSGHRYRLVVEAAGRGPDEMYAWRGTITDLETFEKVEVRTLYSHGSHLLAPMVWSEVFARCEHPRVTARWSGLRAITIEGDEIVPRAVRVNYQSRADGGCDNTTVSVDELGILQVTNTERQVPQDATLPVPG